MKNFTVIDRRPIYDHLRQTTAGETLLLKRLKATGLTDEQITVVLGIIDGICTHCWDSDSGCQCWNDE